MLRFVGGTGAGWPIMPVVVVIVAIALRFIGGGSATLAYLLLGLYALMGRRQTVESLSVSWLITMVNPGIFPEIGYGPRYIVLVLSAVSALWYSGVGRGHSVRIGKKTLVTIVLGVFLVMHSILISRVPDVSVLKSMTFVLVFVTLISVWSGMRREERADATSFLFGLMILVLVVSLSTLMSEVGYFKNGHGFQGILDHPQAFGVFVSILAVWVTVDFFIAKRFSIWKVGILLLSLVSIFLSEARTAGLGMLLGLVAAFTVGAISRPRLGGKALSDLLKGRVLGAIVAVSACVIIMGTMIGDLLDSYLSKRNDVDGGLADVYEASRGGLIEDMLQNIEDHPLFGIGFGVSSVPDDMEVVRDPVTGFPLSAAVEKGVMPLAVVEELGLVGAVVVYAWILWLLWGAVKKGLKPAAIFLTVLFLNLGEMTFFSPGGMGLFHMIVATWAISPVLVRRRRRRNR